MSDFLDLSKLPHLRIIMVHKTVLTLTQPSSLSIYYTCEAFIVRQDTPHVRECLFHATMPSSARSAHPNSQFAQHSVYPRTKRFRGEMSAALVASVRRSAFSEPNRFMPRNKTDGFCPPSPCALARGLAPRPRPHTLGKAAKADFSFVRLRMPPPPRQRRPLINGRNPRKS